MTSHENLSHEDIDSIGFDWDVAANRQIAPKRPLRVYLPETTREIAEVLREASRLQLPVRIRSKGHSSNQLVLADRGTVLWTEYLNGIGEIQEESIWVQAGAVLAQVDAHLEEQGWGLPVIGDHNHITAGGFASVGGVSPASNRYGLFIDNVEEIEWVNWEGNVQHCSRTQDRDDFLRLLGGTGQHGVIARLRCRIVRVRKSRTIVKNERVISWRSASFLRHSANRIRDPQGAQLERGLWLDFPIGSRSLRIGQYSSYHKTKQTWLKSLRDKLVHGYLHGLGYVAGRLPRFLDLIVQRLGMLGVIFAPRYASIKNVESFTDKVLDTSVGDPHRMLIVFAPAERYERLFSALYDLCLEYRKRGCLSFIAIYVKGIDSAYLRRASGQAGDEKARFCEVLLYLGVKSRNLTEPTLEELVLRIDELCETHGALRYMHTRTVASDHRLRKLIDPNARVEETLQE